MPTLHRMRMRPPIAPISEAPVETENSDDEPVPSRVFGELVEEEAQVLRRPRPRAFMPGPEQLPRPTIRRVRPLPHPQGTAWKAVRREHALARRCCSSSRSTTPSSVEDTIMGMRRHQQRWGLATFRTGPEYHSEIHDDVAAQDREWNDHI